jgi:hypothetical protein
MLFTLLRFLVYIKNPSSAVMTIYDSWLKSHDLSTVAAGWQCMYKIAQVDYGNLRSLVELQDHLGLIASLLSLKRSFWPGP